MNRRSRSLTVALLISTTVGCSTPQPPRTEVESQQIVKEEVLATTTPPECEFKFEVFVPKAGQPLTESARLLLRSLGNGIAGVAEGSGLSVSCGDTAGSGWIDQSGELQSFIAPPKGWFVERSGTEWKSVSGQLHIITKTLPLDGKAAAGRYVMFAGAPLGPHSTRLLQSIGIGVAGAASTVRVEFGDGTRRKGLVTSEAVATITPEPWNQ